MLALRDPSLWTQGSLLYFDFDVNPRLTNPAPLKGLDIRILIIIPIKGRGFMNQGSTFVPAINPMKAPTSMEFLAHGTHLCP